MSVKIAWVAAVTDDCIVAPRRIVWCPACGVEQPTRHQNQEPTA